MFKFKSKIDKLVDKKAKIKIQKQNIQDKMHEVNSNIETKLKKLENKAQANKVTADAKIAELDREFTKICKLIGVEKDYVLSIENCKEGK